MTNPVLERIAEEIKDIEASISEARELIEAMREAGEDVSTLERTLVELETRKERWSRMLKARGIIT